MLSVQEKNVGLSLSQDLLTFTPKNSVWNKRNYKANSGETGISMPKPKNGRKTLLLMKVKH